MTLSIPEFEIVAFHGRQKPYALIIGVYNEGEKFTRQLALLQPYRESADIIIADGGSTDGATAADAISGKAAALLVNRDKQRGLSVQYRAALHYALSQGYHGIIMMDGNGKDGVDALPQFIKKLNEGYDFVQGSRFMPGGHHENTPLDRVIGIRFIFTPLMHLASGFGYTDAMNGFKACSRKFLCDARLQPLRRVFVRYSLQYYLNYRAPRLDMRIVEIPVTRAYPGNGASCSKIKGLYGRLKILCELFGIITGRYNP